jgi:multiple sugar transport system permease protein
MTDIAPQAPSSPSAGGRTDAATRAGRPGGRGHPAANRRRRATPYLFLVVPMVLLIGLTYLPVANMVGYSFTDWDGLDKTKHYVGLDNYVDLFTQPRNVQVFRVSLYYFVASFVQMGLALYFATVLSFKVRFRTFWKGILFFPYLINGVAIGLIFLNFLQPDGGLDATLRFFGLNTLIHQWTGDPALINYTLASVSVWRYLGLNFVMFLGAIQSIPSDIYEAAEIDGAARWHQFRWIILPSIGPIVSLSFILAISGSLSVFEIPFIMTQGGNGSETFVIRAVKLAFNLEKVGLASAMAVVLLLLVLLVSWVQRRFISDEGVDLS